MGRKGDMARGWWLHRVGVGGKKVVGGNKQGEGQEAEGPVYK